MPKQRPKRGQLSKTNRRRSITEGLREQDGDDCYCCGGPMDFTLPRDDEWAPTIEHKTPLVLGGSNKMENLALSHQWCNSKRTTETALRLAKRKELRKKRTSELRPR